jgi:hypothetical protein
MKKDLFVEKFEESLFDDSAKKITTEITELGFNVLIETGVVKAIPFANVLLSGVNVAKDIYARHLLKNTLHFLQHLNDGSLTEKEREKFVNKISKESSMEEELERILLLLHRATEYKKSIIYAKLLKALAKDIINLREYHEMMEITDRIFIDDFNTLIFIYNKKEINDKNLITYNVGRLESLGLVQNYMLMTVGSLFFTPLDGESNPKEEKAGCFLTEIGEKYVQIIYGDRTEK